FAEELVGRRLVRKGRVLDRVVQYIRRLVAREGALDVNQDARHGLRVNRVVADLADGTVPLAVVASLWTDRRDVDFDRHTQVAVALADQAAEVAKLVVAILSGVAGHDETTVAA